MITDTIIERRDNDLTDKLLGIPTMFDCSRLESQHRNRFYRKWRLAQATPKGCKSGALSRYKAIHKRGLTVDHIVPLSGIDSAGNHVVCGLNVAWNLRGETKKDNVKKANLFVDSADSLGIIPAAVNRQLREKRENDSTIKLKKMVDNLVKSLV